MTGIALLCFLLLHPPVHFLPVPHLHHEDKEDFVPNLINDAVVLPRSHIDAMPRPENLWVIGGFSGESDRGIGATYGRWNRRTVVAALS